MAFKVERMGKVIGCALAALKGIAIHSNNITKHELLFKSVIRAQGYKAYRVELWTYN